MNKFYLLLIAILVFNMQLTAQKIKPLADLNPGVEGSYETAGNNVIEYNGFILFTATTAATGAELYKYDGTSITLVKDINPGASGSKCDNFYIINKKVMFTANNGSSGVEWWSTDGTEAGTKIVKDLAPGAADGVFVYSSGSSDFSHVKNDVIFFAGGPVDNVELYKTDGTEAGTVLVKNLSPDNNGVQSSFPEYFVEFKGETYFGCRNGFYKTDGTTNGTVLVKADVVARNLTNFKDQKIIMINGALFTSGNDLWISDGTTTGTTKIKSLFGVSRNWSGNRFSVVGDLVLFPGNDRMGAGDELWRTDGTEAGTKIVLDLLPGSEGYAPQNTVVLKNKLYYKGESPSIGIEFFTSDGTAGGTKLVKELSPGFGSGFSLPTEIITDGKNIFMNGGAAFNKQLWISDGTTTGTKEIVINPNGQAFPLNLHKFGNKLFMFSRTENSGYEPYIVEFNETTAVKNEYLNTITTYPNPVTDHISINGIEGDGYSIILYNTIGQEVLKTNLNGGKANAQSLSSGHYIITVIDTNGITVGREAIIKQ